MSRQDSLAMATSAEQRQQGAGHAMPGGKAAPREQTQVGHCLNPTHGKSIQLALQVPYMVCNARHYRDVLL